MGEKPSRLKSIEFKTSRCFVEGTVKWEPLIRRVIAHANPSAFHFSGYGVNQDWERFEAASGILELAVLSGGASSAAVLAQLPCGPSLSGIACQSVGYELEARTGKILRRMEPKEFALRWQQSMAWKFHDPGPPRFLNKQSGT